MIEVSYIAALLAGAISFLSPCVLPLVPPYLCYMAGVSLETLTGEISNKEIAQARKRAFIHSIAFVIGFSIVFIILGAGASSIGQAVRPYIDQLAIIAGIIIILMGLHFLGVFKIGFLYREARFQTNKTGLIGSLLMGIAFAFGWTPCIGPVLGAILAMAGNTQSVSQGAFLLGVYSIGLGIPFLLASLFIGQFMTFLSRFRKHLGVMEKIMGIFLILTGIAFLTGNMARLSYWLIETFPALGTLG